MYPNDVLMTVIRSLRYQKEVALKKLGMLKGYSDVNGEMEGRYIPNRGNEKNIDVMVIAAHPDDETISISGLLQSHVKRGETVAAIFVTSGGRGPPASLRLKDRIALREREAINALKILGVPEERIIFLGFPDRFTPVYIESILSDLRVQVRKYSPNLIYTHSVEGGYFDHDIVALTSHLAALYEKVGSLVEWAEYNSTFPLSCPVVNFPDYLTELSMEYILEPHQLLEKRKMLECYKSQNLSPGSARAKEVTRPVKLDRTIKNTYNYNCFTQSHLKIPKKRIKQFLARTPIIKEESL